MRRPVPAVVLLLASCAAGPRPGDAPPEAPADPARDVLAAVLAREDRRDAKDGFLVGLLADPDAGLRRRACLALGRIGDPASVPDLGRALADADPLVRADAAFGLGEIADPAVVAPLLSALADPDRAVRAYVLEALTKSPTPEGSAAALAALGKERDPGVVASALPYTFRFRDTAWLPLYLERAVAEQGALYALVRLDLKGILEKDAAAVAPAQKEAFVQAMIGNASSRDPFTAALAARGLGRFPEQKVPFRDQALRLCVGRPEVSVRVEALRAAGELLRGKGVLWPEVRKAADEPLGSVRLTAMEAMASIGGRDAEALLRERRRAGASRERAVALASLFALGPSYMDRDLGEILRDEDWQQRAALAAGLSDPKVGYGAEALLSLSADPDVRVRAVALSAVASRALPEAPASLRAALAHPDVVLRATAADEIGKGDDAASFARELRECWTLSERDPENDARLSLLDAFAKGGLTVEIAFALEDADWLVRRKAATLLATPGAPPRDVAPLVPRPVDYRAALDPARSRRARVETSRGAFEMEFLWDDAPLTCLNFATLARRGFYDGLAYHRIVPGFVVQDGCPRGDGSGGPGHQIRCEINTVRYGRGMVGMALSGKDTGGSQYFVTLAPTPHLDGGYTVFARVVSGMDVVESLVQGDRTLSITLP